MFTRSLIPLSLVHLVDGFTRDITKSISPYLVQEINKIIYLFILDSNYSPFIHKTYGINIPKLEQIPTAIEKSIGIDVGDSYSCIATYNKQNINVIPNDIGNRTTPCSVSIIDNVIVIGETAKKYQFEQHSVSDITSLMHKNYENTSLSLKDIHKSLIFSKMKSIAALYHNEPITNAVITVPLHFNDEERQYTKEATQLSGLNCLKLINEPTAACIAYDIHKKSDNQEIDVLVIDYGANAFKVSIYNVDDGVFENIHCERDTTLGGNALDTILMNHFITKLNKDIIQHKKAMNRLRIECEKAKGILSKNKIANIDIESLYNNTDFVSTITRARFEYLCNDHFRKCIQCIGNALNDANINRNDIDYVVLSGGGCNIPVVQQMIAAYFNGNEILKHILPEEVIAYGAAKHANVCCGYNDGLEDIVCIDVTPLSFGIKAVNDVMIKLIARNSTIPCKMSQVFTTHQDANELDLSIMICEGERQMVKDNNVRGIMELKDIAESDIGEVKIAITFNLDSFGILTVFVQDGNNKNNSVELKIDCNRPRITQDEIQKLIEEAEREVDALTPIRKSISPLIDEVD